MNESSVISCLEEIYCLQTHSNTLLFGIDTTVLSVKQFVKSPRYRVSRNRTCFSGQGVPRGGRHETSYQNYNSLRGLV